MRAQNLAIAILTALWVLPPVKSVAQAPALRHVLFLKGECKFQLVMGWFPCDQKVVYTLLKNGRMTIIFMKEDNVFTLAGGSDRQPNLTNYYVNLDTIRIMKGTTVQGEDRGMEGECHMRINREGTKTYFVHCDIYNRAKGSIYHFNLDNITVTEHTAFD